MAPGARSKFGAPMFEPKLLPKQIYCIEESTSDIFGTFRRLSHWFGARRIVAPCSWRPCVSEKKVANE